MSEHTAENDARCPGCGSVVSDRFQTCRPVSVDVTKPGYRYLSDTWGYCLHLGRHIGTDEPAWRVIPPEVSAVRGEGGEE